MRAKEYRLIEQCVENGVEYGYNRAHKHTDTPTKDGLCEAIYRAVLDEICEAFTFAENKEDEE